jgi:hypothetical protein
MCLEALFSYDPDIGPLENYLVRHVGNRMKNLKRDYYFRPGSDVPSSGLARTRMNLVNALPLECGDMAEQGVLLGSTPINIDPAEHLLCADTLAYVKERLPESLHESLGELLNNNKVRRSIIDEIKECVSDILSERDDSGER